MVTETKTGIVSEIVDTKGLRLILTVTVTVAVAVTETASETDSC